MAAAGAVVFDASAALEILLPDAAARFAAAVDLVDKICSRKVVAHIPLACFNEFATGCARAVRGRRTSASVQRAMRLQYARISTSAGTPSCSFSARTCSSDSLRFLRRMSWTR